MFYESARRYRFRRFAVLRSMPLSSAPNSCAVISRRCSAPSPNGTAYVPSSSRLLQTAKPSRSQYRIFTRSLRRLVNTNRCPAKASSSRCSRTSACRLSKLLRISHGVRQRYTRTLAGKWIMPAKHPALSATYRGVHAAANTQPRAGCQHQLQYRFGRAILPSRAPFHQSEPHRPSFLEPFTPTVKGPLRQPLFPAELLDGHPAAPLRRDSFGPLVCFRVERLRLNDSIAHDTTMHRRPVRQKERFTRRLRSSTKFGLRRIDRPSTFSRNNRNPSRRSASMFSEYSSAFSTATAERGLRYETECFGQTHSAIIPAVAVKPTEEPRNRRRSSFIAAPRRDESSRHTSVRELQWRESHYSGCRGRLR